MNADLKKVLIDEEVIKRRVEELGAELSAEYRDSCPLVIATLKGSVVFFADLIREMPISLEIDFLKAASYGDRTESCGDVSLTTMLSEPVASRRLLIVEDIIDSGRTIACLKSYLEEEGAAEIRICSLLDKPERRVSDVKIDYLGFSVPDEFVVGYGLDYNQKYRNLPYIGVLKEECYQPNPEEK